MVLPVSIKNLIKEFSRLPGIGPKTSERLVFSLLRWPKSQIFEFIKALSAFSEEIHLCASCYNFTNNGQDSVCAICADPKRDQSTICVVADTLDLIALEATDNYHGLYHILGGVVNPLKGVKLADLRSQQLIARATQPSIKEIILAFDPNQEGELTCYNLKQALDGLLVKITRLARGLPQGGDLDYADEVTLTEALKGRREV